jgi:hypothetical protein
MACHDQPRLRALSTCNSSSSSTNWRNVATAPNPTAGSRLSTASFKRASSRTSCQLRLTGWWLSTGADASLSRRSVAALGASGRRAGRASPGVEGGGGSTLDDLARTVADCLGDLSGYRLGARSFSIMSTHSATHWLQMQTQGPAISLSFWRVLDAPERSICTFPSACPMSAGASFRMAAIGWQNDALCAGFGVRTALVSL